MDDELTDNSIALANSGSLFQQGEMQAAQISIASLFQQGELQAAQIAGLQNTEVFTWSTDSFWSTTNSAEHTFARGIRGGCINVKPHPGQDKNFMGFRLTEGPVCTMHYK